MTIETEFNFGDLVFLKTDAEQKQRMVTSIVIKPSGVVYSLSCGVEESSHYPMELTSEKDWNIT